MTREEAFAEAFRRWGKSGRTSQTSADSCLVASGPDYPTFTYGIGGDWEDAFADADRRAQEASNAK